MSPPQIDSISYCAQWRPWAHNPRNHDLAWQDQRSAWPTPTIFYCAKKTTRALACGMPQPHSNVGPEDQTQGRVYRRRL